METEIRKLVEEDRELKEKTDRITKVKGLGLITAVTVLCETNGFRLFNNIRQAVSYAGLDTVLKEPGKFKGRTRISRKRNAAVRQCLFMPALSAANHNSLYYISCCIVVPKRRKISAPHMQRSGMWG
ncbi:Transposase IS116/IS110/IS902 family protein [Bacteroidales bacterium Barb6]|nr:Transposase IS116/IS110/IS902 family protein [Bacteroidales bacterium Barb6]